MNQTLQLTDYIPQNVSLYYVDYRDDLDEHEDIQEECVRSNNMEKLYEKAYEWYEEQESSNMHDYLEETRKNMETDNLAGEFEEHEDEIRELIYDRNDSDPVKDLIRNSSVTNFFYSLGVEISGYLTGCSLRGESVAMACHKVRRALHLKKGQFDEKIEELVENATYGGELRIYFNAMFDRLISKDPENDFKSIRFHGNVMVAIADSRNICVKLEGYQSSLDSLIPVFPSRMLFSNFSKISITVLCTFMKALLYIVFIFFFLSNLNGDTLVVGISFCCSVTNIPLESL